MTELARGFYILTSTATLRSRRTSKQTYPELLKLTEGDLVYASGGQPEGAESYFDGNGPRTPGWRTDHTWVVALSTMDDRGETIQGWIDNSRMNLTRDDVSAAFKNGDVLYGRREAREPWVQRLSATPVNFQSTVARIKYNIIDDLNYAVRNGNANDESVQRFAEFIEEFPRCKGGAKCIRQMCKSGLTYITQTCKRNVHFVLDGLDPRRVMEEAGVYAQQGITSGHKFCTGAEMRRLMRQRLADEGKAHGRDYKIDLRSVSFYLAMARVPAPWESGAPPEWAKAWRLYDQHRKGKLKNTYI